MDPEQKLTETRDEPQSNIEDDMKDTSILSDQNDEQNTKEDDNVGNGDAINGNTVDEEARSNEQRGYSQEELPQFIPTESNAEIPTDETQDHGPPEGIGGGGGGGGSTSEDQIKTGMKKGKRSKKLRDEDGVHRVTLTVTIAKAIPSSEDDGPKVDELMKRKKRIVEAPKANGYYHCQYYLLPDDEDPTKTDVVTFGMAAKIYTETDSKVLKTWQEGDQTWIAWSHSHTLKVTKELLLKLFDHTLELRIWESRDKVSARARFDRPKAFRLPQPKPGEDVDDVGGVKSLVLKQSKSYLSLQPKKSFSERPVPQNAPPELSDISNFGKTDSKGRPVLPRAVSSSPEHEFKTPEELLRLTDLNRSAPQSGTSSARQTPVIRNRESPSKSPTKDVVQPIKTYNHLSKLAGIAPPPEVQRVNRPREAGNKRMSIKPVEGTEEKKERQNSGRVGGGGGGGKSPAAEKMAQLKSLSPVSKRSLKDSPQQKEARRKSQKVEQAAATLAAYIKENGNACIPIRMKLLFSGLKSVTNRLDRPVPGIEDVFITVAADGPLMSEELHREVNPLVIKVASASDLPTTPLSLDELSLRCQPVYTEYKFHELPEHHSSRKPRAKNVYWEDLNVVLLGTIPQGELLEYLRGPPLEIHLHDRDRKPEDVKAKPLLFGADMEDDKISNVGMVTSKRTIHNPFKGHNKPWDPYGIAKFDLSPLLLGERTLFLTSPVHNCPIPDQLGRYGADDRLIGVQNAVDGPKDEPLPAGHYIDAGTQMKVKVQVAYPLISPAELQSKPPMTTPLESPFSNIIFIFEYKNSSFLHQLLQLVTKINSKALNLDVLPDHIIQAALSTYKLSETQQDSKTLNIVTGFQIMDGEKHIFVLEGLRDEAIQMLWETLPRAKKQDGVIFEVLYNSDFTFRERKYASLDVDLCRVKLHEPLSVIVQQPLLYVRDMVPPPCLEALVKLDQLVNLKKLRDVTKSDLFPSAASVISLSREFGVPLTTADFEDLREANEVVVTGDDMDGFRTPPPTETYYQRKHSMLEPLDIYNSGYMEYLADKEYFGQEQDYITANILEVAVKSQENVANRVPTRKIVVQPPNGVAHNYSTQMLNSTEQAMEALRQHLAQEPDKRFTYCSSYNSAAVVPVNLEALEKQEVEDAVSAWQTGDGFVYPGVDTATKSNVHPRKPDQARIDELEEHWQENTLHANTLKPTLEERERFSWPDRKLDMNLWRRPSPKGFAPIPPITIHAAGETLRAERRAARDEDDREWQTKLVVDDTEMHHHRLTSGTELLEKGFHSSNQLDRLNDLLKDQPQTLALRQANFQQIPALGVVQNPNVDRIAREEGVLPEYLEETEYKEKHHGFVPGAYDNRSLLVDSNRIAIKNMEHQEFINLKGHDFRLYHKERSPLHKPLLKPLSQTEKANNLFKRVPTPPEDTKPKHGPGNVCFRQPPPAIRPAPVQTEYYYPDREIYWKSPCSREATNKKQVITNM